MIKLDNEFKETYFKYYSEAAPHEVLRTVINETKDHSMETLIALFNVAKTSDVVGHTYIEYYFEASKMPAAQLPDGDKVIFNAAFHYLYNVSPTMLEAFLDIRFTTRNIYAEVANIMYGKFNEATIEKVKSIKTEDGGPPRPRSRDEWFYNLTIEVGSYSKCLSRRIGSVLVRDNSVVSTGYNGPPRGVPTCDQRWHIDEAFKEKYGHHILPDEEKGTTPEDPKGKCPRKVIGFPSGQGLDICVAGHAERNALINAARFGIPTKGTKMYMSCGVPCTPCMVELINAGVEEIICSQLTKYDESSWYVLENSDLKVRLFDFLA